uniref:Uncharacterized protein n=1 Tax=Steinernema glaseri TaxID=37863 RepID=A0A1I8AHG3_9BILA
MQSLLISNDLLTFSWRAALRLRSGLKLTLLKRRWTITLENFHTRDTFFRSRHSQRAENTRRLPSGLKEPSREAAPLLPLLEAAALAPRWSNSGPVSFFARADLFE